MGGGPELKGYVNPSAARLDSGNEVHGMIMNQMKNGLDPRTRDIMIKRGGDAIKGMQRQGMEQLGAQLGTMGSNTAGSVAENILKLKGMGNKSMSSLYEDVALENENAKDKAFGKYANMQQLAIGQSDSQNNYQMKEYEADALSRAAKGQMWGSVLGTGGKIATTLMK